MTKYVDIDAAKEAVRKAECDADYDGRRFDAEFIENALDFIPAADVAPVVHGRWIFTKRHLWYKDENGNIDEWRVDNGFHNGPECQICHTAFCEHCTPDWSTTECEIGHYYCSECAETSRDAHEDYCPNCGAKMDGGADK